MFLSGSQRCLQDGYNHTFWTRWVPVDAIWTKWRWPNISALYDRCCAGGPFHASFLGWHHDCFSWWIFPFTACSHSIFGRMALMAREMPDGQRIFYLMDPQAWELPGMPSSGHLLAHPVGDVPSCLHTLYLVAGRCSLQSLEMLASFSPCQHRAEWKHSVFDCELLAAYLAAGLSLPLGAWRLSTISSQTTDPSFRPSAKFPTCSSSGKRVISLPLKCAPKQLGLFVWITSRVESSGCLLFAWTTPCMVFGSLFWALQSSHKTASSLTHDTHIPTVITLLTWFNPN